MNRNEQERISRDAGTATGVARATAERLLESVAEVREVVDSLRREGWLALDTEFVWTRTYRPALGVVQLGAHDGRAWVVDGKVAGATLGPILADRGVVKVLHDARQDLALLVEATKALPHNIFDTRLAAGFIGLSPVISLKQLLQELLGVVLPKTETRTDWCRRPLSVAQLDYALSDVRHLGALYDALHQKLLEHGSSDWLSEELELYEEASLYAAPQPQDAWQRLKLSARLGEVEWALAVALATAREELAQEWNMPRLWIADDATLVALATSPPRSKTDIRLHYRLRPAERDQARRYLMARVESFAAAGGFEGRVAAPQRNRRHQIAREEVDAALTFLRHSAGSLRIAAELYGSRTQVAEFIANPAEATAPLARGWRFETAGRALLARLGHLPL